jgi:CRISPR-associated protein Cas2
MRRRFLVTYDICNDKRLKKVFKAMNDFGDHLQFSVFFCELNEVERIRLESRIKPLMNEKDDQVLIVDLGLAQSQTESDCFYCIGKPLIFQTRARIV